MVRQEYEKILQDPTFQNPDEADDEGGSSDGNGSQGEGGEHPAGGRKGKKKKVRRAEKGKPRMKTDRVTRYRPPRLGPPCEWIKNAHFELGIHLADGATCECAPRLPDRLDPHYQSQQRDGGKHHGHLPRATRFQLSRAPT